MEGILSQEEINALLSGADIDDGGEEQAEEKTEKKSEYVPNIKLTKDEEDAVGEVGNISLGSSSTALSTLLSKEVQITTPKVQVYNYDGFLEAVGHEEKVLIQIEYRTGFVGLNVLLIDKKDAALIGDLMMGNDGNNPPDELDDLYLSAVSEAMNQMMGSSATALAGMFSKEVDIMPPKLTVTGTDNLKETTRFFAENEEFITVAFDMEIENLIKTKIYQVMAVKFAKNLISELYDSMNSEPAPKKEEKTEEIKNQQGNMESPSNIPYAAQSNNLNQNDAMNSNPNFGQTQTPNMGQGMQQMNFDPQQMMQQQMMMQQMMQQQMMQQQQNVNVQPAEFMNFGKNKVREMHSNMDMIMDVPLQVTVELGRTRMLIKEILDLGPGSIVELDKLAGEPVDILVNNKLIAKGEVVVIDESFGVRITDIISKMERMNKVQ